MTTGPCYIDTSVLVAALGNERHTESAQNWLAAQPPGDLLISDCVITEFSSAMALKLRTGQLQPEHRAECLALFTQLVERSLTVLTVTSANFRAAGKTRRPAPNRPASRRCTTPGHLHRPRQPNDHLRPDPGRSSNQPRHPGKPTR